MTIIKQQALLTLIIAMIIEFFNYPDIFTFSVLTTLCQNTPMISLRFQSPRIISSSSGEIFRLIGGIGLQLCGSGMRIINIVY